MADVRDVPFAHLHNYDRRMFAADREPFLRAWITQPDARGLACVDAGAVRGCGVIRRSRRGFKIGPLFADSPGIAERLYLALCRDVGDAEPVYLDVPEVNAPALQMARQYGMREVFGTARMYTGEPPPIPLDHVYGVTTFELG
jgi:hypothetical protein